jgi:F-type H+-transporting ATPase subunit delta
MAQETIALARPYAEAVLKRAQETNALDNWSEMLWLLSTIVQSPEISAFITDPRLSRSQVETTLLEIGGDHLNEEGQNLLKILMQNNRLALIPDITTLYEQYKHEHQGAMRVLVQSAYALDEAQEQTLAAALKERLQRDIEIHSEQNSELIGGIIIHAGDLVIDGSVRGQLHRLANQLRI